eukprot:gene2496-5449_t
MVAIGRQLGTPVTPLVKTRRMLGPRPRGVSKARKSLSGLFFEAAGDRTMRRPHPTMNAQSPCWQPASTGLARRRKMTTLALVEDASNSRAADRPPTPSVFQRNTAHQSPAPSARRTQLLDPLDQLANTMVSLKLGFPCVSKTGHQGAEDMEMSTPGTASRRRPVC